MNRPTTVDGKRMLVTGSTAGIGYDIARLAIEYGARVVINGRDAERLERAASALGVAGVRADVGVEDDCKRLVNEAAATLNGLDVLINNAAWGKRMPIEEFDADLFAEMWRTNVVGPAVTTREAVPHLRAAGGGDIVNIASTAGTRGFANGTAYVATKFALRGMTQCWQAELRPHDIRVILVNPSEVQTGFGGRDSDREKNPNKLIASDIAEATISALTLPPRALIAEVTVFATNPWCED